MKLRSFCLLLGVLMALSAVNTAPASATDFSGYVEATYDTDYQVEDWTHANWHKIKGGAAWIVLSHWSVDNIGEVPLTEAVYLVEVQQLQYYDEDGVLHTVTDPVELAQLVRIQNSDEMWQDSYVTWLGTIKPGHSRKAVTNFWVGVGNWSSFMYHWEVWYLA